MTGLLTTCLVELQSFLYQKGPVQSAHCQSWFPAPAHLEPHEAKRQVAELYQ